MKSHGQTSKQQNEVWKGLNSGVDLKERIPQIVNDISKRCAFIPNQILSTSSWWNKSTGIGAFHFSGKFNSKPATLKVQGVKPTTSEIYMIESFEKQNKSKIIRPPHIYARFRWDENKGYEAFVLEDAGKKLAVNVPTNKAEVDTFFDLYQEYKEKCLNIPWIDKPNIDTASVIKSRFKEWSEASLKIFPNHPFRKDDDKKLISKAVETLIKNKEWLALEFVHGHFSTRDLYCAETEVIILSNLYWSWRTPYYDLIFAYHWFMYDLTNVTDITPQIINEQRNLWLNKINSTAKNKTLLKYALLERAAAGLNLDALSIDINKPSAKYLVDETRRILIDLIKELS